jgi:crotonobetainyl-CoA:carnitine CoA-transferase CaiB-like acyl-CoA transferase
MTQLPLSGVRVLDFSTLLPGPLATLMLAEAGAEVVKVERPGSGDEMRAWSPRFGDTSANFAILNRGKRSMAVDLKSGEDRRRLQPLLEQCDVLVEQFRPGVMKRLDLDYESVRAINPGVVYCSITGYGQTGPRALIAGHDLNYVGDAGMLDLVGREGPELPSGLMADVGGGTYAPVINILLALMARDRSGKGCHLDVAMAESVFPFMYWAYAATALAGEPPRRGAELLSGGSARYAVYETADGRHLAAAPLEERFWQVFCDTIELEEPWRDDRRDPAGTRAAVASRIARKTASEWAQLFDGRDACCSVVRTVAEALEDEQFRARGVFAAQVAGDGRSAPALPLPICAPLRRGDQIAEYPRLGEYLEPQGSSR